jgi:hypothetical protein
MSSQAFGDRFAVRPKAKRETLLQMTSKEDNESRKEDNIKMCLLVSTHLHGSDDTVQKDEMGSRILPRFSQNCKLYISCNVSEASKAIP